MSLPPSPPSPLRLRKRAPLRRSALLATLFGLLIPGGGQMYLGRFAKAFLMLLGIGGLIVGGCMLTNWTCIHKDTHKLELLAHAFNLGPTAYIMRATEGNAVTEFLRHYEVGRLYVAVAGLLNVVAICDAWGLTMSHNRRAEGWRSILSRRAQNAAMREENARVRALLAVQESALTDLGETP